MSVARNFTGVNAAGSPRDQVGPNVAGAPYTSVPPRNLSGDESPVGVVHPEFAGQVYEQSDGTIWKADDLLSSSWVEIGSAADVVGDIVFGPNSTVIDKLELAQIVDAISVGSQKTNWDFPNLITINGPLTLQDVAGGFLESFTANNLQAAESITYSGVDLIPSVSFPALLTLTDGFYGGSTITSLELPSLTVIGTDFFNVVLQNDMTSLVTLNLNSLPTVNPSLTLVAHPALASLLLGSLITVTGGIDIENTSLTALNLQSLVTVNDYFIFAGNPATTLNVPSWMPTNGTSIIMENCALNAVSINQILARCIAAGVTTCNINLSGGTNAAPTGQGITDKAALILAGNTVVTN